MELSTPEKRVARFGLYEADLQGRVLIKSGLRVKLQDQPFQVLALLLDRPGEVVTRDQIRQKLWASDTFVEFDDGLNSAIKKLRAALSDAADNPRFIETVPRRGYRFLAPVMFLPPAGTPTPVQPTTQDIVIAARERSRVVVEQRTLWVVSLPWVGVAVLLAIALGFAGYSYRSRQTARVRESLPEVRPRPSVAVIGFRNLSSHPEDAWLSVALTEMLSTELAAGEKLRMVSGEQVTKARLDLRLPDAETLAKGTLTQLRTNLAADYVVLGSYTSVGEPGKQRIRLDLRVQDAVAGETVVEEAVTGSEVDLFEIVADAGARMRTRLGAGAISSREAAQVRASLPAAPGAARLYSEGLAKLRVFDAQGARDLMLRAVDADPDYPLSHSALASAWFALGYDTKARQEAKLAFDHSLGLSPQEALWVEGAYREAVNEWPRAVQIYQGLWNSFPDDLEYGLKLAVAQVEADRGKDALQTVASLHKLPAPAGVDPRIDLIEDRAADSLGDAKHRQQAAAAAGLKAQDHGERLVLAEAREHEGWAWVQLGDYDRGQPMLEQARDLYLAGGNRRGAAAVSCKIGDVIGLRGDLEGSRKVFEAAAATCRSLGSLRCLIRALTSIANTLNNQGKPEEAKRYYQQVLPLDEEIGNQAALATTLGNLGDVLDDLGELAAARKMQEQALSTTMAIGDKYRSGSELFDLGELMLEQGELKNAQRSFERAAQIDQEIGYKRGAAFASQGLGEVFLEEDKIADAERFMQEALSRWQALGDREHIAESSIRNAAVLLEDNRPAEAEKLTRDALHQFENAHAENEASLAYALMSRALLIQGKLPEAQTSANSAALCAKKTRVLPPHYDTIIVNALVFSATGRQVEALRMLAALAAETRKLGYVGYELHARLEMAKIEVQLRHTAQGNAHLTELERDARSRGFLLIARQAASCIRKS